LLATYENYAPHRLPCFVLMGNFSSTPHHDLGPLLDELASLIYQFESLAQHAHFVLIPGPHDVTGGGQVLPLPALRYSWLSSSSSSSSQHPTTRRRPKLNVHSASNPCRIYWQDQEMVVFRYDLLHLLQHHQIMILPHAATATAVPTTTSKSSHGDKEGTHGSGTSSSENDDEGADTKTNADITHDYRQVHCQAISTILDQGYLVPVAGVPIIWNQSHTLSLYPLPTALVLGGDAATHQAAFYEVYGGVHVLHPGSFGGNHGNHGGSYATYTPSRRTTHPEQNQFDKDNNDDDDDSMEEDKGLPVVEFGCMGDSTSNNAVS
jgi:DNA polymerase epsilon subunit 2